MLRCGGGHWVRMVVVEGHWARMVVVKVRREHWARMVVVEVRQGTLGVDGRG